MKLLESELCMILADAVWVQNGMTPNLLDKLPLCTSERLAVLSMDLAAFVQEVGDA